MPGISHRFAIVLASVALVAACERDAPRSSDVDYQDPVWLAGTAQTYAVCIGTYRAAAVRNRSGGHEDSAVDLDASSQRAWLLARALLWFRAGLQKVEWHEAADQTLVEQIARESEERFIAQGEQGTESGLRDNGLALGACIETEPTQNSLLGTFKDMLAQVRAEQGKAPAETPLP